MANAPLYFHCRLSVRAGETDEYENHRRRKDHVWNQAVAAMRKDRGQAWVFQEKCEKVEKDEHDVVYHGGHVMVYSVTCIPLQSSGQALYDALMDRYQAARKNVCLEVEELLEEAMDVAPDEAKGIVEWLQDHLPSIRDKIKR